MSDLYVIVIVLVLAAIYLLECLSTAPIGAQAFQIHRTLPAEIAQPLLKLESIGQSIYLASFIPAKGEIAVCPARPPISPLGICTCDLNQRDARPYIAFSEIKKITSDGTGVFADSVQIARTVSSGDALKMVGFLSELCHSEFRADLIQYERQQRLNTNAVRSRFRRLNRVAGSIDWEARFLLALMFCILPATVWFSGLRAALPVALLTWFLCVRQIVLFARIHSVFHKNAANERRSKIFTLLLSPPATIRIRNVLTRDLLSPFHPLAVARATCSDAGSRQFVSTALRRLLFPADFEKYDLRCPVARWDYEQSLRQIWDWAEAEFGDTRSLIKKPPRRHPSAISYCPRCVQEFRYGPTECPDCPGVTLRDFNDETEFDLSLGCGVVNS